MIDEILWRCLLVDLPMITRETWKGEAYEERPNLEDVQLYVFPQTWATGAAGYDVFIASSAITTCNTVVVVFQDIGYVYFGGPRLAYKAEANEAFLNDVYSRQVLGENAAKITYRCV